MGLRAMGMWFWTVLLAAVSWLLWRYVIRNNWYRPRTAEAALSAQGIRGPPREFLFGNFREVMRLRKEKEGKDMQVGCHDIEEHVLPYLFRWAKLYGSPFLMWWGDEPRVVIKDLEMVKEVLLNKSLGRAPNQKLVMSQLLGRGIVTSDGEEWAVSRHILTPVFHSDKIKGMAGTMTDSIDDMLKRWEEQDGLFEMDAEKQFTMLTAEIISRTAFGSSYEEGQRVFKLLEAVGSLMFKSFAEKWNLRLKRQINKMKREIATRLEAIIETKRAVRKSGKSADYGDDLLGILLREAEQNQKFTKEKVIDECKTFYVAGHETTATLLTWTVMLLAENPLWQERARAEVMELCGQQIPTAEAASKMKTVGMVLNEALRLYPPAPFVVRYASKSMELGKVTLPAGVAIVVHMLDCLHNLEVWGDDGHEFRPDRFAGGISKACKDAFAYMPFAHGHRICIGQSFALMEGKLALAMLLQRFRLEPSPNYRHCPVLKVTVRPKHGMPVMLRRL